MLKGIATSDGIAIGKVYKLEQPIISVDTEKGNPEVELKRNATSLTSMFGL